MGRTTESIGRNYYIDSIDILESLMDSEAAINDNLHATGKTGTVTENISGIIDYATDDLKGGHSSGVSFSELSFFPQKDLGHTKRLGLLYFSEESTNFDLVNNSTGEIIIPRKTSVVELRVPTVNFSGKAEIVTPAMVSRSLGLVADYISRRRIKPDFVIGLTHPRMGAIATKRWGFTLEEHPFPKEAYEMFDMAMKDESITPDKMQNLEAFKNQVLVYQPRADFIKRTTTMTIEPPATKAPDEKQILLDENKDNTAENELILAKWAILPLHDRISIYSKMGSELSEIPDLISVNEAAELKRFSARKVRHMIEKNIIPAIKINNSWLVLKASLNKTNQAT